MDLESIYIDVDRIEVDDVKRHGGGIFRWTLTGVDGVQVEGERRNLRCIVKMIVFYGLVQKEPIDQSPVDPKHRSRDFRRTGM